MCCMVVLLWSGRIFLWHYSMPANWLLATWRDGIKTGSMTVPVTSVLLSMINALFTKLCCGIQLVALFMSDFPPSVRPCSASYVGWRAIGALIQSYADVNDARNFYEALNVVYAPNSFSSHPVRRIDGNLIMNEDMILAGWAEYLQNLMKIKLSKIKW